jgi:hypothetical protein
MAKSVVPVSALINLLESESRELATLLERRPDVAVSVNQYLGWPPGTIEWSTKKDQTVIGHYNKKLKDSIKFTENELILLNALIKELVTVTGGKRTSGKRTKKSRKTNRGRRNRSRKH